ncbi:discoidin domain-containing protein, partial [Acinetobacter baumannii]|nr:discoidin domain-containing protein [Acinetobacter baumannii]
EIQAYTGTPAAPEEPNPNPDPGPDPVPGDPTKPGVAIKPVEATSSTPENGSMAPAMAIDGKLNTRWSSKPENGAWIQFDFGKRTALGYI